MERMLMGAEAEYALVYLDPQGQRLTAELAAKRLLEQARLSLAHLPSADGQGIFLANGGKYYIDSGYHNEWATPECTSPTELVRYILAGDRLQCRLSEQLGARFPGYRMSVFRGNVGYASEGAMPETWGTHESYLTRNAPTHFLEGLPSFLASRILYSGSGGWDPFSGEPVFTLSPRAHFLTCISSNETTSSRPLLNLRDQALAGSSFRRLHLICGDALGSEAATWLRAGATALVVTLLDEGAPLLRSLTLENPLAALHTFSTDPTLTAQAPLRGGGAVTALELQWRYLHWAKKHCQQLPCPEWTERVLEGWENLLTLLERGTAQTSGALDWAIKRTIYADLCAEWGVVWGELPRPKRLTLTKLRALRARLWELDTRYLELGDGVFASLVRAGAVPDQALIPPESVDAAVSEPPATGRAALRGRFVQETASLGYTACGWTELINTCSERAVSLSEPFGTLPEGWAPLLEKRPPNPRESVRSGFRSPLGLRTTALEHYRRGNLAEAQSLLETLLEVGFEVPGTHVHLARLAAVQADFPRVRQHIAQAWERRAEGPAYVRHRILWFQLLLALLDGEDARAPLDGLYQALQDPERMDWTMEPVLEVVRPRLGEDEHALLTLLVSLLSGEVPLIRLDNFFSDRWGSP